jgi:hypothetical protein
MLKQEEISRDALCKILRSSGKNELERNNFFMHCKDAFHMEVLCLKVQNS